MKKEKYIFLENLWHTLSPIWKLIISNCLKNYNKNNTYFSPYIFHDGDERKYAGNFENFPAEIINKIYKQKKLKIVYYSDAFYGEEEALDLGILHHFFPNLEVLIFESVALKSLEGLHYCKKLKHLEFISYDNMASKFPIYFQACSSDCLAECKELETLIFDGNLGRIAIDIEKLASLPRLQWLELSNTLLTKITENDIAPLNTIKHLNDLNILKTDVQTLHPIWELDLKYLTISKKIEAKEVANYKKYHPETLIFDEWRNEYEFLD